MKATRGAGAVRHAIGADVPVLVDWPWTIRITPPNGCVRAPSLVFNTKDDLQARWVRRLCRRDVELPRHAIPSAHAFVVAALAGLGWGLHPQVLVASHLAEGSLVELVPDTPLDVPLYWQHARAVTSSMDGLGRRLLAAAEQALLPP